MTLRPCRRCGAQSAAYLNLDFECKRRRCSVRDILDAKRECLAIAMEGPESTENKRRAAQIAFETMATMVAAGATFRDWQEVILQLTRGDRSP